MPVRVDRSHPALKHGAYSATTLLPGESRAEFEKLHRDLMAELTPSGVLEDDIVKTIAHLVWRKQNLATLRIAERAQARRRAIVDQKLGITDALFSIYTESDPVKRQELRQAATAERQLAEGEAREELGELYELTDAGESATFDGLTKELEIRERLDAAINRLVKQLLMVRGVKSMTVAPQSASPKHVTGPQKPRS